MTEHGSGLTIVVLGSIACILLAATIVLWFLFLRPPLNMATKLFLFFGVAVFPITAAMGTNLVGYQTTQTRAFCSSCHVMTPYTDDSGDFDSTTLASRHARNGFFGDNNCYTCHSDYGIYGTVVTKLSGLKHVWIYYSEAHGWAEQEAFDKIHLYRPFINASCTKCHSKATPNFNKVRDHVGAEDQLVSGAVTCASRGCHGPAHPFSKPKEEAAP